MTTFSPPIFHVTNSAAVGTSLWSVRSLATAALAAASLLLVGFLAFLVAVDPATPLWALPLGLVVLWKMGLFVWATDLRTAWALHDSPIDGEVLARSLPCLKGFLLSDVFARTVQAFDATTLDLRVTWRWAPEGLEGYVLVATAGPGKTVALQLNDGWKPPTIPWDHPSLIHLARRKAAILEGRWATEISCISIDIPVGSAHARMALFAWASDGAPSGKHTA